MRSAYVEIFADPRADLPSAVGPAGSSTTCPRLASREYCRPTVAGDMEITDSMGNASTKRNGKERTKIERRRQRVTESSDLFFILLFFLGDLVIGMLWRRLGVGQLTWILPEGRGRSVHTCCTESQFLGGGRAGGHQVAVARKVQIPATGGT